MLDIVLALILTLGGPTFIIHELAEDYAIIELNQAGIYRVTANTLTAIQYELTQCQKDEI